MNKLLIICLQLLAAPSFAANDSEAAGIMNQIVGMGIKYSGTSPELAHKYFSDIFGSFIFLPWGQGEADSVTLLAHAIGFTNILALFLGMVIIFYVMIGGAIQTAHSGETLGRNWSAVWVPIRAALGFGLIMPAAGIGGGVISVAQIFIIWLMVLGSNAATVLWNKTVDMIGVGTPMVSAEFTTGVKPTGDMLKMLACTDAYIRNITLNKKTAAAADIVVIEVTDQYGKIHKMPASIEGEMQNLQFRIPQSGIGSFIQQYEATHVSFADAGRCGNISIGNYTLDNAADELRKFGNDDVFLKKQRAEALTGARNVISATIDRLAPIVRSLKNSEANPIGIREALYSGDTENSKNNIEIYRQAVVDFGIASSNYSRDIVLRIHEKLSGSKSAASEWSEKLKNGGWIKAGTWFHEISNFSSQSSQTISDINSGIVAAPDLTICTGAVVNAGDCEYKNKDAFATMKLAGMISSGYITSMQGVSNNVTVIDKLSASCQDSNSCSATEDTFNSIHRDAARGILNLLSQTSLSRWDDRVSDASGMANPFEAVTAIGRKLNGAATLALAGSAAAFASSETIKQGNSGISGSALTIATLGLNNILGGVSAGTLDYLKTVLLAIAIPLMSAGFILAYLIPFLPVITWVQLVAGYLLTAVESCIAAPLAIILMVTPEGEGISGTRLERSMQLIGMAILKPSLLIIGLIASITLSYVSFGMMNLFFFEAAGSSLSGSILDFLAIIFVYCIMAMTLCKLCIGIMYKLSDQILDWFSSGVGRQFGESDSAAVIGESLGNMRSGAGSVAQGIVGRLAEKRRLTEQQRNSK